MPQHPHIVREGSTVYLAYKTAAVATAKSSSTNVIRKHFVPACDKKNFQVLRLDIVLRPNGLIYMFGLSS